MDISYRIIIIVIYLIIILNPDPNITYEILSKEMEFKDNLFILPYFTSILLNVDYF